MNEKTVRRALIEYIVEQHEMGQSHFHPVILERIDPHQPLSGLRILRMMVRDYRNDLTKKGYLPMSAYPDPRAKAQGGWYIFSSDFVRWLEKEKIKVDKKKF